MFKVLTDNEKRALINRAQNVIAIEENGNRKFDNDFTKRKRKPARFLYLWFNNVEDPEVIDTINNVAVFWDDIAEYYEYPENGVTFAECEEYFDYVLFTRENLENCFLDFVNRCLKEWDEDNDILRKWTVDFYTRPVFKLAIDNALNKPDINGVLFVNCFLQILAKDETLLEAFARYVIYVYFPCEYKLNDCDNLTPALKLFNRCGAFKIK